MGENNKSENIIIKLFYDQVFLVKVILTNMLGMFANNGRRLFGFPLQISTHNFKVQSLDRNPNFAMINYKPTYRSDFPFKISTKTYCTTNDNKKTGPTQKATWTNVFKAVKNSKFVSKLRPNRETKEEEYYDNNAEEEETKTDESEKEKAENNADDPYSEKPEHERPDYQFFKKREDPKEGQIQTSLILSTILGAVLFGIIMNKKQQENLTFVQLFQSFLESSDDIYYVCSHTLNFNFSLV